MSGVVEQIRAVVEEAARAHQSLRIEGGGSKGFYGCPVSGSPVATLAHSGIVEYEPSELVVTVRAGTPLAALEAALDEAGQMLPFEPPYFGENATVGGAIATGLSGPRRAYAGSARDFVLGAHVVDGSGRLLRFGGRVIKNVAGFDAARLMVGAQGTLGVLTEVSLKVLPRPHSEAQLEFEMSEADAIRSMNEWAGKPWPITATFFHGGRLRVRLAGAEPAVEAAVRRLGGASSAFGAEFWRAVREHELDCLRLPAGGRDVLWRIGVASTAAPLDLPGEQAIEWGGSLRWLRTDCPASEVRAAAALTGGHASVFRGEVAGAPRFQPLPGALAELHRRVKAALDPAGILNPGRIDAF